MAFVESTTRRKRRSASSADTRLPSHEFITRLVFLFCRLLQFNSSSTVLSRRGKLTMCWGDEEKKKKKEKKKFETDVVALLDAHPIIWSSDHPISSNPLDERMSTKTIPSSNPSLFYLVDSFRFFRFYRILPAFLPLLFQHPTQSTQSTQTTQTTQTND